MHQSQLDDYLSSSQDAAGKRGRDEDDQGAAMKKHRSEQVTVPSPNTGMTDEQLDTLFNRLSTKLTSLTSGMEQRFSESITTSVRAIFTEEINSAMNMLRDEFKETNQSIEKRLDTVGKTTMNYANAVKVAPNDNVIVVKNLEYTQSESINVKVTENKVNSLLKDGLGIMDSQILSAERTKSKSKRPGIVLVKCRDKEVDIILKNKRN